MKQYTASIKRTVTSPLQKTYTDFDTNNISSVFVNGELREKDEDYTIEEEKIVFKNKLAVNDLIDLNYTIDTNKPLISAAKTKTASSESEVGTVQSNSVLTKYGSHVKLSTNNKYTICIVIDKDEYKWQFNSKRNPMFTSAKKILEDIGEFIEGFTEKYINSKIYDNSVAVIDLIDTLASQEEPVENVTYEQDENGFYTTTYKAVQNWVRYKTDIDLTLARYFGISYRYGSQSKTIGDIKIEKSVKLPYIDNMLELLKKKFEEADQAIRGVNVVASSVKAGTRYKYDDWDRDTTW